MKAPYLSILLLILSMNLSVKAQQVIGKNGFSVVQVDSGTDYIPLRKVTYILKDNGLVTPQQILSGKLDTLFQPLGILSFPAGDSVKYWGRVSFESLSKGDNTNFFFGFVGRIGQIELFSEKNGQIVVQRTGKFVPFHERAAVPPSPLRFHGFDVLLNSDSIQTFYFRVTHMGGELINSRTHPYYYSKECLSRWALKKDKNNNLYLGGILILLVIALSLMLFNKRRVYVFYFLYLCFILIYLIMSAGYLQRWLLPTIFKDAPIGFEYLMLVNYFIAIAYIAFIRKTIDVKNLLPFWYRLFRFLIWLGVGFMIFSAIWMPISNYNPESFFLIFGVYVIPCLIATMAFLIPLSRTKSKFKYFVLLGILSLNIGSMITVFKMLSDTYINSDIIWMQLGALGEIVIFAVGLGFRQRILEKEKLNFQSLLEKHLSEKGQVKVKALTDSSALISKTNIPNGFLDKVIRVINENIEDQQFGVEELVQKCGMSRSQFHRKITESAGVSANQLIKLTRLTKGKELLKNSQTNIAEVAYSIGFSDPGYFTKVFKKEFGITPKKFREDI